MTDTMARPERVVGAAKLRKEDAHLVTGATTWTDNIALPGMLYLSIVRGPLAQARITGGDAGRALASPGVVAAFSGRDLADKLGSMPCVWPVTDDIVMPPHPPLAVDEVRYVGDAVAVVVA